MSTSQSQSELYYCPLCENLVRNPVCSNGKFYCDEHPELSYATELLTYDAEEDEIPNAGANQVKDGTYTKALGVFRRAVYALQKGGN